MRKTSQDGGDASSITSGVENEVKKSVAGIAKIKRNSIKRKVQNFSNESDDGVIEPLLSKEKEKVEVLSQSAKFLLSKTKTDIKNDRIDDKQKPIAIDKIMKSTASNFPNTTGSLINGTKDYKCYTNKNSVGISSIHNHMNTNVFGNSDSTKNVTVPKTQVLVEIDGSKSNNYNSGPLIFTTAKIHTDGTNKQMEPVHVTPVPILSTVEGSTIKTSPVGNSDQTLAKSYNVLSSDIKKLDVGPSAVFGNNFRKPTDAADSNTITPVRNDNSSNKTHECNEAVQAVTDKSITSTSSKVLSTINKDVVHKPIPDTSSSTVKNEITTIEPVKHKPKLDENISSTSFTMDVNKNFESGVDPEHSDSVKTFASPKNCHSLALKDNNAKTDGPLGTKPLQHLETLGKSEDLLKTTNYSYSEPINTQTTLAPSHEKISIKDKITSTIPPKSIVPNPTASTSLQSTSVTKSRTTSTFNSTTNPMRISNSITKSTPVSLSMALNTIPAVNTKKTIATPTHTVSVMSTQVKSLNSDQDKSSGKTNIVSSTKPSIQKTFIIQTGKNPSIHNISSNPPDASKEMSTKASSAQNPDDLIKANNVLSTGSAACNKVGVKLKSTDTATCSNIITETKSKQLPNRSETKSTEITKLKPSIITTSTCSNTIMTETLKPITTCSVISDGSTRNDSKMQGIVPHVVSDSLTTKTTSSYTVTTTSNNLPQSAKATAGKSLSSISNTTSSSKPNTNIIKKTSQSSSSTNAQPVITTSVTGVKSTATTSMSISKPSMSHNQQRLEHSASKKEKLK